MNSADEESAGGISLVRTAVGEGLGELGGTLAVKGISEALSGRDSDYPPVFDKGLDHGAAADEPSALDAEGGGMFDGVGDIAGSVVGAIFENLDFG